MYISENGAKLLEAFEQPKLVPYLDSGTVWTIGWGHALTTPEGKLIRARSLGSEKAAQLMREAMTREFGKLSISLPQAIDLLKRDLKATEQAVGTHVCKETTQTQFDALVVFAFNVGEPNFASSTLLKLHNAHQPSPASSDPLALLKLVKAKAPPTTIPLAFTRWSYVEGEFCFGLFRRRLAEYYLYNGQQAEAAYNAAYAVKD